jgi:hypothetical protein
MSPIPQDDFFAFVDVFKSENEMIRVLVRVSLAKLGSLGGSEALSAQGDAVHDKLRLIACDALRTKFEASNLGAAQVADAGWVNLSNFGPPDYESEDGVGSAWIEEEGDDIRFK